MATSRSRHSRDDDEDDDDRPRRKRRDDDDDDDERPRSRRKRDDDDDDDERPRRKKRRDDDDDDDDRPARRKKRRKSGGSGLTTGQLTGIFGGILALVIVVVVVLMATGNFGSASISYEKYKGIRAGATLESLEKSFGKATKLDKAEVAKIQYAKGFDDMGGGGGGGFGGRAGRGGGGTTLADLEPFGTPIEAWYHWHSGSEDIYIAFWKDQMGRTVPLMKVYTNSNALNENKRANGDINKMIPQFMVEPVN